MSYGRAWASDATVCDSPPTIPPATRLPFCPSASPPACLSAPPRPYVPYLLSTTQAPISPCVRGCRGGLRTTGHPLPGLHGPNVHICHRLCVHEEQRSLCQLPCRWEAGAQAMRCEAGGGLSPTCSTVTKQLKVTKSHVPTTTPDP
jgi:hypothetical protein